MFFCSIHKAQPNYVKLEENSRVSMYSNWKVVAKDSHPSGLSPRVGMSCYRYFLLNFDTAETFDIRSKIVVF